MRFRAALFDMDGTLIDSMGVWAHVDEVFFMRRGIPLPEDYARSIAGLSFRQTGEYTKARFQLPESVDDILREWHELCESAYVNDVPLKPHAAEYLKKLRGEGDAESARIYAEAANRDPGFYAFQRSLEAYRKSFAGGDSVIVLERDDPFLQYMRSDR